MSEVKATVTRQRRVSRIWLVPIVALLLGAWMVVYTWQNQGPEIEIIFATADGIEAGTTKIKARSVEVGLVERVVLGEDFESVIVTAQLSPTVTPLLREDTQFWVVQARIGAGGVSDLGTIVSGGYIELSPGVGEEGRREFIGLNEPSVTPAGTPGLDLTLVSDDFGALSTGNPILYKGFRVGRIEGGRFDVASQNMYYRAFIEVPYDDLVTTATRFWTMSGLSFSATADGIEFSTGSLESILAGGVSFGLPVGAEPGGAVEDGASFDLFPDRNSINERPYRHYAEYVVEFARSVRGLSAGAPVEYRGLRAGTVERILVEELVAQGMGGEGRPIPVRIRVEPGRLKIEDSEEGVAILVNSIRESVKRGLRATLATGNLLTGSLYVSLDMYPDEKPAEIGDFAGQPTIPTIASGLEGISQQVSSLLAKLNDLPLHDVTTSANDTLRSAGATLEEMEQAVSELKALLTSEELQNLPLTVQTVLDDLDRTLENIDSLAGTIEEQPNSLLFPRRHDRDPVPPAGSQ